MEDIISSQLQIIVCDDDSEDCRSITEQAGEILTGKGIDCCITAYHDAITLLEAIEQGKTFDVLLLDVMMEGLNGMELAKKLRRQGNRSTIVFISSNREMALCGYEVQAVRFLGKPLNREKLREALEFSCQEYLAKREILLPTLKGRNRITLSELIFAEAQERKIRLCLTSRETAANMKFSDLLELLPGPQFLQIHRSYVVNLSFVQSVESRKIWLKDGRWLPISRYRFETVQQLWANYLNR